MAGRSLVRPLKLRPLSPLALAALTAGSSRFKLHASSRVPQRGSLQTHWRGTSLSVAMLSNCDNGLVPEWLLTEDIRQRVGVSLFLSAFVLFVRAKRIHMSRMNGDVLVTNGLYSVSRNPLAVSVLMAYSSVSLLTNNSFVCATVPMVFCLLRFVSIPKEESELRAKFGQEYDAYCATVGRFFSPLNLIKLITERRQQIAAANRKLENESQNTKEPKLK